MSFIYHLSSFFSFVLFSALFDLSGYWCARGLSDVPMPLCTRNYDRCGSIRIEIIDQGPGVTRQEQETLFQEGVQLHANQLQSGQGRHIIMSL